MHHPVKALSGIAIFAACLSLTGCSDKEYYSFEELDNRNILEYIEKNNLNVSQYKNTDLFYEVLEEGTGNPIDYKNRYPVIYTVKSLDGKYNAADTLNAGNRYSELFGYFPFGSGYAGRPEVERTGDFKEVIREVLKKTNGKIRIIVPSRLLSYGRDGNQALGIPPNASMDYVVTVHDNFTDYEDGVIQKMITNAGLNLEDFTKTEDNSYYRILTQGTGDPITADSTVTVSYTLKNPAGGVIETNDSYESKLSSNIQGFQDIVTKVQKGGKVRFFLPSTVAYGTNGSWNSNTGQNIVPQFFSLDYEVEVKNE